jgi:hypothetical protein
MQVALTVLLMLILWGGRIVGQLWGWYYHAALLVVLALLIREALRLTLGKPPAASVKLPPAETAEAAALSRQIELLHKQSVRLHIAMKRDTTLLPVAFCAPVVLLLAVFRQASYDSMNRWWFVGVMWAAMVYFAVRYYLLFKNREEVATP